MESFIRRMSMCFAAGSFGGLVKALSVWYLGTKGIPQHFGVSMAPELSKSFVYQQLVWGGLWGFVFMMPILKGGFWMRVFSRGILFGFLPSLFALLYVFPVMLGKGMLGLSLGRLAPVFVCLNNAAWGLSAAIWLYVAGRE